MGACLMYRRGCAYCNKNSAYTVPYLDATFFISVRRTPMKRPSLSARPSACPCARPPACPPVRSSARPPVRLSARPPARPRGRSFVRPPILQTARPPVQSSARRPVRPLVRLRSPNPPTTKLNLKFLRELFKNITPMKINEHESVSELLLSP